MRLMSGVAPTKWVKREDRFQILYALLAELSHATALDDVYAAALT
jgi:hypothetical protein